MERILTPWTGAAFNDITWTELHSGRGSSGFNREYFRKHYPSLGKPDTYWLEYIQSLPAWSESAFKAR